MITKLSEKQFIERFGEKTYLDLAHWTMDALMNDPKFQNNEAYLFQLMKYKVRLQENLAVEYYFFVEADIRRIPLPGNIGYAHDFGIRSLTLTDEPAPDEVLDRYNEIVSTAMESGFDVYKKK